jgi:hypothetical protein
MGTRNLIEVYNQDGLKVSQYGQWDGYPEGQGKHILNFLHSIDILEFNKKLDNCKFLIYKDLELLDEQRIPVPHHRSRDRGAEILEIINNNEEEILELKSSHSFGFNSLFCEFAYVIDICKNTFEIYEGFNHNKLEITERFYSLYNENMNPEKFDTEYFGVKLIKTYYLNNLPDEETFLKELNEILDNKENE